MQGIHILRVFDENILQQLRNEFLEECKQFQEFTTNNKFVLGGFGAIGVASSFHNLFIRKIRLKTYKTIKDKLHIVHNGKNIEMFFDRMMYRPKVAQPTKELWHRDLTPNSLKNDIIIGGWLNLDSEPQYFSCIPGSHNDKFKNKQYFPFLKIPLCTSYKNFKNEKFFFIFETSLCRLYKKNKNENIENKNFEDESGFQK